MQQGKKNALATFGHYNARDDASSDYSKGWNLQIAHEDMADNKYTKFSPPSEDSSGKLKTRKSKISLPKVSFKSVKDGVSIKGSDRIPVVYLSYVPFATYVDFAVKRGIITSPSDKSFREALSPEEIDGEDYVVLRLAGSNNVLVDILRIFGLDLYNAAKAKGSKNVDTDSRFYREFAENLIEEYGLTSRRINDDGKTIDEDFEFAWAYTGEKAKISAPTYHQAYGYVKKNDRNYERQEVDLLILYTIGSQFLVSRKQFSRVNANTGTIISGDTASAHIYKKVDVNNFQNKLKNLEEDQYIVISSAAPKVGKFVDGKAAVGLIKLNPFTFGKDGVYNTRDSKVYVKGLQKTSIDTENGKTTVYDKTYKPKEVLETFAGKIGANISAEDLKRVETEGKSLLNTKIQEAAGRTKNKLIHKKKKTNDDFEDEVKDEKDDEDTPSQDVEQVDL